MPTTLRRPADTRLPPDVVAAWREIPSAVAADRLAGRGHVDPRIRPIRPFAPGLRLVGSAVTAWCEPADYGPVHHAIAEARAGDVVVVAAGGRRDAAMIGDLLSGAARRKGIAGVVVDGAVRDTGTLVGLAGVPRLLPLDHAARPRRAWNAAASTNRSCSAGSRSRPSISSWATTTAS